MATRWWERRGAGVRSCVQCSSGVLNSSSEIGRHRMDSLPVRGGTDLFQKQHPGQHDVLGKLSHYNPLFISLWSVWWYTLTLYLLYIAVKRGASISENKPLTVSVLRTFSRDAKVQISHGYSVPLPFCHGCSGSA